VAFYFTILNG